MTSSFAFPRFALVLAASGALCLATTHASADEPAPSAPAETEGTHAGLAAGITLTVLGPLAVVGGVFMSFFGIIQATTAVQCGASDICPSSGGTGLFFGGLVTTGGGIAATVIGAVLIGNNSGVNRARTPVTASAADAARRPIWNAERPPVPATPWVVPVLSASF